MCTGAGSHPAQEEAESAWTKEREEAEPTAMRAAWIEQE